MIDTSFEQQSVDVIQRRAYSFQNMPPRTPDNPLIDAARGREPQPVKCLSCGGTFVRAADGSIPCGH